MTRAQRRRVAGIVAGIIGAIIVLIVVTLWALEDLMYFAFEVLVVGAVVGILFSRFRLQITVWWGRFAARDEGQTIITIAVALIILLALLTGSMTAIRGIGFMAGDRGFSPTVPLGTANVALVAIMAKNILPTMIGLCMWVGWILAALGIIRFCERAMRNAEARRRQGQNRAP